MEAASVTLRLRKCQNLKLQKFKLDDKGRIHLISNIKLCLTVAHGKPNKGRGRSPIHQMKSPSWQLCSDTLEAFQMQDIRTIE